MKMRIAWGFRQEHIGFKAKLFKRTEQVLYKRKNQLLKQKLPKNQGRKQGLGQSIKICRNILTLWLIMDKINIIILSIYMVSMLMEPKNMYTIIFNKLIGHLNTIWLNQILDLTMWWRLYVELGSIVKMELESWKLRSKNTS